MKSSQHHSQRGLDQELPRAMLLLGALLLAGESRAAVIFDNGTPNQAGGNEMSGWVQAEDFSLAETRLLTDVHFWTVDVGTWDGQLGYYFFADNAGSPGAVLDSGSATNLVRTATGNQVTIAGFNPSPEYEWSFDLASPFLAAGGTTYWLGLHASANFNRDEIFWEWTGTGFGSTGYESGGGTFNNWNNNFRNFAFNLTGSPVSVPEPATLSLFGVGVAGFLARRRKAAS